MKMNRIHGLQQFFPLSFFAGSGRNLGNAVAAGVGAEAGTRPNKREEGNGVEQTVKKPGDKKKHKAGLNPNMAAPLERILDWLVEEKG